MSILQQGADKGQNSIVSKFCEEVPVWRFIVKIVMKWRNSEYYVGGGDTLVVVGVASELSVAASSASKLKFWNYFLEDYFLLTCCNHCIEDLPHIGHTVLYPYVSTLRKFHLKKQYLLFNTKYYDKYIYLVPSYTEPRIVWRWSHGRTCGTWTWVLWVPADTRTMACDRSAHVGPP